MKASQLGAQGISPLILILLVLLLTGGLGTTTTTGTLFG